MKKTPFSITPSNVAAEIPKISPADPPTSDTY